MAIRTIDDSSLAALADAIRAKGRTTQAMTFPDDFVNGVRNMVCAEEVLLISLIDGTCTDLNTEKLTEIGQYTFYYNTALKSVNLPEVLTVGDYGFQQCNKMETVSLAKATYLGVGAFRNCIQLHTIHVPNVRSIRNSFYYCSRLQSISMPLLESVTSSGFFRCTALTYADLGLVAKLSDTLFQYCTALTTLVLRNPEQVCVPSASAFNNTGIINGTATLDVYVPRSLVSAYEASADWAAFTCRFLAIEDNPNILAS